MDIYIKIAIILVVLILAFVGLFVEFTKQPKEQQVRNIKEWLKWAVTMAEKELGSGTGQLKLAMVYNLFVEKFPAFVKIIPFDTFSKWVDESLEWLKNQLDTNDALKTLVQKE